MAPLFRRHALALFAASVLCASSALGDSALAGDDPAAGYLGAQLAPEGTSVRVVEVVADGPAARAGLRPGDIIVRARGGSPGSVQTFITSVRAAGAGTRYPLEIRRGTRRVQLTVPLESSPRRGVTLGQPAPTLSAQVVMGPGPADLARLRGRVVIVDFWATWCGPCRAVMPLLDRFHRRFAAQGLSVVGVTNEPASLARQMGAAMDLHYTLATDGTADMRFGVQSLPTLLVIDRSGRVRHIAVGVDPDELRQIEALVQRLLAEAPP